MSAHNSLGDCYDYGDDRKEGYALAVEWWKKTVDEDHAAAQSNLGQCYKFGEGDAQSDPLAAESFRKAADQGHAGAQHLLDHFGVVGSIGFAWSC